MKNNVADKEGTPKRVYGREEDAQILDGDRYDKAEFSYRLLRKRKVNTRRVCNTT